MRVWFFLTLIGCLGFALISTKPLENAEDIKTKIQELNLGRTATQEDSEKADEDTYLSIDPGDEDILEDVSDDEDKAGGEGKVYYIEVEDDESDDTTIDRPSDEEPVNFLKYPENEGEHDYTPYPRFAILKNGFVNHVNLDF